MPFSFDYDREQKILSGRAEGVITFEELLAYLSAIVADEEIEPGFVELIDFSAVEDLAISYGETQPFGDMWKKYVDKGCVATIVYAPDDFCFGMSRMFQTVIRSSQHGDKGSFVVVRTPEEVKELLAELRPDD